MRWLLFCLLFCCVGSCKNATVDTASRGAVAAEILGNPKYPAICYGGYRMNSRTVQPTIAEIKEDLKLLQAVGIRLLRTYNVHLPHAANVLKAIRELKEEEQEFEMYVMLGAWIDCKNAWTSKTPIHHMESDRNAQEILEAMRLAKDYSDIVKVISVGNESMVKWATSYYVSPEIVLKWVQFLQEKKRQGALSSDLWITSSDNYASWGGGSSEYHTEALEKLIATVDFISLHTYPMHDTHYKPDFWGLMPSEQSLNKEEQLEVVMDRATNYAKYQYANVVKYVKSLGIKKLVHIGETGWSSQSNGLYGPRGSQATDEYKAGLYYRNMRAWTQQEGISCFYFEAFDEPWKDAENTLGSENYFGLFTKEGKVKFALWDWADNVGPALQSRNGKLLEKTYGGNRATLLSQVVPPVVRTELKIMSNHE